MNTKHTHRAILIPALLLATAPGALLAGTLTVTAPTDPVTPLASRCTDATASCSLRDALAAADATAEHDFIVFDIDQPVRLTRKLTVQAPVTIDGGGTAEIRLHQGYTIASLRDRYSADMVPVLQPVYTSAGAGGRYMLELSGSGSSVTGITFDGSITPRPGEAPVDRVDFDADGVTDYILHHGESDGQDVWLVAGGILADFTPPGAGGCEGGLPLGTVNISGNRLANLGNDAIRVAFQVLSTLADNDISGGGVSQAGWFFDGINMFCSAATNVTGNRVSRYRNGVSLVAGTALNVSGNEVSDNAVGLDLEFLSGDLGPSLVENNESASNAQFGMLLLLSSDIHIVDNEFRDNGTDPQQEGGLILIGSSGSVVAGNESAGNSGFGIALDRSWFNELTDNEAAGNGGAGMVLVNDAQYNAVASNEAPLNGAGIVLAKTIGEQPFPSNNALDSNEAQGNWTTDLVDYDPVCNDAWTDNEFDTAAAASGACIQ